MSRRPPSRPRPVRTSTRRRRSLPSAALALCVLLPAAGLGLGCELFFPERSEGEKLWRKHCSECHGLDGSGNTVRYMGKPYADLLDNTWKVAGDSVSIEQAIRSGFFGEMPSYDHLSGQEVRLLVEYVRELRGEALPSGSR